VDTTALNAQLVTSHSWTETCFLSPQICWLRKIRSVESFSCRWKKWIAWFCCLLDLSSGVISRASFCNFFTAS